MKIEEPNKSYCVTIEEEEFKAFQTVQRILEAIIAEMEDRNCDYATCAGEYNYSKQRIKSVADGLSDLSMIDTIYS